MLPRAQLGAWLSALWAVFLVVGAPWVVYETATSTHSLVVVTEEEREELDEHVERDMVEATASSPPQLAIDAHATASAVSIAAEGTLRPSIPACPSLAHPSLLSVRRLI